MHSTLVRMRLRIVRMPPRTKFIGACIGACLMLCAVVFVGLTERLDTQLMNRYASLASPVTYDRNGAVIRVEPNGGGDVCIVGDVPPALKRLIVAKEDAWFYYHPGINPLSIARAVVDRVRGKPSGGASTISQQLAKMLMDHAGPRTLSDKVREMFGAFALESMHTKDELLTMYASIVPLGGNLRGFHAASRAYFNKLPNELSAGEQLQLVAALSNPSSLIPQSENNFTRAAALAGVLNETPPIKETVHPDPGTPWLELSTLADACGDCTSTIDTSLTERIRAIVARHTEHAAERGGTHAAVVVIDTHTEELIAMVGSPNPERDDAGMRINMALETRPIGSTVKPFLYLLGFSRGLRPYTLADDRELKFPIDTGYSLYPKNYDGTFRGEVTLEEALANSLNVPAVLVARYATLPAVYDFLGHTIGFSPPSPWPTYAYGIPLGGLELDLLTLTHAFTLFAREGELAPLVIGRKADGSSVPFATQRSSLASARRVSDARYVELVNAILSDRTAGVEQFGLLGSLNLSHGGYAVKTGTSRDYHDSWTVGYTGDYAVGVWVGNVDNKPMSNVSGASGAGALWRDVMELMFTTPYYRATPFKSGSVVWYDNARGRAAGLAGDDVALSRDLLADRTLIREPHDGDTLLYTKGMRVPLSAAKPAVWTINKTAYMPLQGGWYPTGPGTYLIEAQSGDVRESCTVKVVDDATNVP